MADPTTQSNYTVVVTKHLGLDWTINFEDKIISGTAVLDLLVLKDGVEEVM